MLLSKSIGISNNEQEATENWFEIEVCYSPKRPTITLCSYFVLYLKLNVEN